MGRKRRQKWTFHTPYVDALFNGPAVQEIEATRVLLQLKDEDSVSSTEDLSLPGDEFIYNRGAPAKPRAPRRQSNGASDGEGGACARPPRAIDSRATQCSGPAKGVDVVEIRNWRRGPGTHGREHSAPWKLAGKEDVDSSNLTTTHGAAERPAPPKAESVTFPQMRARRGEGQFGPFEDSTFPANRFAPPSLSEKKCVWRPPPVASNPVPFRGELLLQRGYRLRKSTRGGYAVTHLPAEALATCDHNFPILAAPVILEAQDVSHRVRTVPYNAKRAHFCIQVSSYRPSTSEVADPLRITRKLTHPLPPEAEKTGTTLISVPGNPRPGAPTGHQDPLAFNAIHETTSSAADDQRNFMPPIPTQLTRKGGRRARMCGLGNRYMTFGAGREGQQKQVTHYLSLSESSGSDCETPRSPRSYPVAMPPTSTALVRASFSGGFRQRMAELGDPVSFEQKARPAHSMEGVHGGAARGHHEIASTEDGVASGGGPLSGCGHSHLLKRGTRGSNMLCS
ncbi:hypothetical protein CYMTET_55872 [Cymbomonas tetramitiformis]|uniref:Uncharacterized protein n=1 Tax=Cymbomonas tetramitiformis TaxID=36881 RepID=A0AAE0BDE7_9CHLO|nr:hypothetical protein CYMTET_55872 [Cymbomonas tetramitiformis]